MSVILLWKFCIDEVVVVEPDESPVMVLKLDMDCSKD